MVKLIAEEFPEANAVVGVATGGIAIGVLVAHALKLPFAYVRPKPKEHGLGNQIEGAITEGSQIVVIEDLISTGGSSLNAVKTLQAAGHNVLGMVAIFTYDFPQARRNFTESGVRLCTLESYPRLLDYLNARAELSESQLAVLREWRESPETWGSK